MKVEDFVEQASKRLEVVDPALGIRGVAAKLDQPGIDLVVVAGSDGKMQGVVTDSDIVGWVAGMAAAGADATAESLMSREVFACTADEVLGSVVSKAVDRGRKHFPILTADGKALGVVYVADALIALHKEDQLSPDALLQYVHGGGYS
jgi:signal-transduction protein with cAMP-binding, CBS, and nucleotidyltransferase domain